MASGSSLIPGSSTVNFDQVSKQKIYSAIDSSNFRQLRDLKQDYELLKFKIGKTPLMKDFINHGARDPFSFVEYSKSYYNFLNKVKTVSLNYEIVNKPRNYYWQSLNLCDSFD